MLPGTLCDARLFAPVLDRLGRTAIVPSLASADSVEAMAELLLDQLPRRFSLVGFSLGAILAFELCRRAPQRIERLALIGANAGALDATRARQRLALAQADFIDATWADAVAAVHRRDEALRRLLDDMAAATSADAYEAQTAVTATRQDSTADLGRIEVSTLVICGTEDRICPPAMSRGIAAAMPRACLVLIPGAGHYVTLEAPAAVADAMADWLALPSFHHFHVKEPS